MSLSGIPPPPALCPGSIIIKTTGLAGGLHWPCKGLIPAALTGPEVTPPATPSLAAPKGAL